jgi:hypothetical protein
MTLHEALVRVIVAVLVGLFVIGFLYGLIA